MSIIDQAHNRDPFALAGRNGETATVIVPPCARIANDELVLALFRRWVAAARKHALKDNTEEDDDRYYEEMEETEEAILASDSGSIIEFALKAYFLLRSGGAWTPGPLEIKLGDEIEIYDERVKSLGRAIAAAIPELTKPLASIIHEDADLIAAEYSLQWYREVWASTRGDPRPKFVNQTVEWALDVIAKTEAKTTRGARIKESAADLAEGGRA